MDAKTIPAPDRLDGIDAEHFSDMLASESFALFRNRVHGELKRSMEACSTGVEPKDIYRAQGNAAALRTILALPDIILAEIRKR